MGEMNNGVISRNWQTDAYFTYLPTLHVIKAMARQSTPSRPGLLPSPCRPEYHSRRCRGIAAPAETIRPPVFGERPMSDFRMSCPNTACAKRLLIPLRPGAKSCKARCSACRTVFRVTLATPAEDNTPIAPIAPHGPSADDEASGGGSYGLAEESSLTYLLRREQD